MKIGAFNVLAVVVLLFAGTPTPGVGARAEETSDPERYAACLEEASVNPKQAFETATAWAGLGGREPAEHCAAIALLNLGQYAVAADRLESLAVSGPGGLELQVSLLGQAAQAWLLAGRPNRSEATLSEALKAGGPEPGLLIDRAQARAAMDLYDLAIEDLDLAIDLAPLRADAFVFRASAHRLSGNNTKAWEDVERALKLDIVHPEGLLERGILKRLDGDDAGARADWTKVRETAPDSEAAVIAGRNLERLELGEP
ncbi:MAG: hypothetical protein ACPGOV_02545 [Magnetovibrionaceae bacterium]